MADILHDFPIAATADRVFRAISEPAGLDAWWTLRSSGEPRVGSKYELFFGPGYDWRATVANAEPDRMIEWEMTRADHDWKGTRVGFRFEPMTEGTTVRFHHSGWKETNEHYRVSSYCWAMYLRILKRYLEHGTHVPYDHRLDD